MFVRKLGFIIKLIIRPWKFGKGSNQNRNFNLTYDKLLKVVFQYCIYITYASDAYDAASNVELEMTLSW